MAISVIHATTHDLLDIELRPWSTPGFIFHGQAGVDQLLNDSICHETVHRYAQAADTKACAIQCRLLAPGFGRCNLIHDAHDRPDEISFRLSGVPGRNDPLTRNASAFRFSLVDLSKSASQSGHRGRSADGSTMIH